MRDPPSNLNNIRLFTIYSLYLSSPSLRGFTSISTPPSAISFLLPFRHLFDLAADHHILHYTALVLDCTVGAVSEVALLALVKSVVMHILLLHVGGQFHKFVSLEQLVGNDHFQGLFNVDAAFFLRFHLRAHSGIGKVLHHCRQLYACNFDLGVQPHHIRKYPTFGLQDPLTDAVKLPQILILLQLLLKERGLLFPDGEKCYKRGACRQECGVVVLLLQIRAYFDDLLRVVGRTQYLEEFEEVYLPADGEQVVDEVVRVAEIAVFIHRIRKGVLALAAEAPEPSLSDHENDPFFLACEGALELILEVH